ncbi:carbon storage regulator CsrA [Pectinatus cerevisiiphilus]|uniref:Translational regulator CsrA n=1 Tax=Pectinatus cerevisiiphilus TaxID=86956 RepID=A0A4R3K9M4_9FIRM|nr:carbon storage regulator CsrA [Pectinatus cerevisiiphilus]TCS79638.1 carbon storage regulator CsrA [Pectinatus cerevisiiphilus]
MLVLTRRPGQYITIGDNIVIHISDVQGANVRLAIDAPRDIKIYRGEIYEAILEENKKSAAQTPDADLSKIMKDK